MIAQNFEPTAQQMQSLAWVFEFGYRMLKNVPSKLQADSFLHLYHDRIGSTIHIGKSGCVYTHKPFINMHRKFNLN